MDLMKIENLSLGYNGQAIVEDLSFSVKENDYLCIIGENGSGKTTLMKTILGLMKPIKGKVSFSNDIRKNDIGYLPQISDNQKDFPATVNEIVLSGFQGRDGFKPFYSKAEKSFAEDKMEEMGIFHLKDKSFQNLSGGQRQRVLLARALCAADKLLVLDEPVTGLDSRATEEMYSLLQKLNEKGIAIVMISHDHEAVKKMAKNVLEISDRIFYGSRDEYLDKQRMMKDNA